MMTTQFCMILRPQDETAFILTQYYWNLFHHHYFSFFLPPSFSSYLSRTHTHKCYIKTHKQEYTFLYSLYNMKSSHISK